jgi:hypothetical protein
MSVSSREPSPNARHDPSRNPSRAHGAMRSIIYASQVQMSRKSSDLWVSTIVVGGILAFLPPSFLRRRDPMLILQTSTCPSRPNLLPPRTLISLSMNYLHSDPRLWLHPSAYRLIRVSHTNTVIISHHSACLWLARPSKVPSRYAT